MTSWDRRVCSPSQSSNPHPTLQTSHGHRVNSSHSKHMFLACAHLTGRNAVRKCRKSQCCAEDTKQTQCNTAWMRCGSREDHLVLPTEQVSEGQSTQAPQSACVKSPLTLHCVSPGTKLSCQSNSINRNGF